MTHSGFRDLILTPLWRRVCLKKDEIDHFASLRAEPFSGLNVRLLSPDSPFWILRKQGLGHCLHGNPTVHGGFLDPTEGIRLTQAHPAHEKSFGSIN